jgi:hypothetical protein
MADVPMFPVTGRFCDGYPDRSAELAKPVKIPDRSRLQFTPKDWAVQTAIQIMRDDEFAPDSPIVNLRRSTCASTAINRLTLPLN